MNQRVITCIICDKLIAQVLITDMSQKENEINAVCDRCLELWEKSENQMAEKICDYRERLQINQKLG